MYFYIKHMDTHMEYINVIIIRILSINRYLYGGNTSCIILLAYLEVYINISPHYSNRVHICTSHNKHFPMNTTYKKRYYKYTYIRGSNSRILQVYLITNIISQKKELPPEVFFQWCARRPLVIKKNKQLLKKVLETSRCVTGSAHRRSETN